MRSRPLDRKLLLSALGLLAACARVPPGRFAVDQVTIEGAQAVSASDVRDHIATAASPKFLGALRGVVFDYELYDPYVLERDLARVERYYRSRGYYRARARAARVERTSDEHVAVTIAVDEGSPVLLRDVRVEGLVGLEPGAVVDVLRASSRRFRKGRPFDEERFKTVEQGIARALADAGYAYATVSSEAFVDLPANEADVVFRLTPGPKSVFGAIELEGLEELPESPVRRALDLAPGESYSAARIEAARRAALELGVFSSVEIVEDKTRPESGVVPLTVRVQRSLLRQVKLGLGGELDVIRTDLHVTGGWQDRNFLGGLRRLSIDVRPGVVLFPTRLPDFLPPKTLLPESRVHVELRQPGFIEPRTTGVQRVNFNIYPYGYPLPGQEVAQDQQGVAVPGYRELVSGSGVERRFGPLLASVFYNLQLSYPFTYGSESASADHVILSYLDLSTVVDLRNDPIRPTSGVLFGNDLQVGGGPLGGSATDLRVQPEVRGYVPISRSVTLAARATAGFLLPRYAQGFESGGAETVSTYDEQLVYLRGFFSGGPASNRAYAFRGVGPHGRVGFFIPELSALSTLCSQQPDNALCQFPLGGLTLWEASLEVRARIRGALGGAVFCDSGDVSRRRWNVRLDYPHLGCGLGLHYDTPVGPFRLDFGYQIPGAQVLDPKAAPSELPLSPPWAISLGIGEAF